MRLDEAGSSRLGRGLRALGLPMVPKWTRQGNQAIYNPEIARRLVDDAPVGPGEPAEPSELELFLEDEAGFPAEAVTTLRRATARAGREPGRSAPARPIRLAEVVRAFYFGGTEVQLLELLRGLPARYEVRVGVQEAGGPLLESVQRLGHQPRVFPIKGGFARPNTALQLGRLAWWLRQERIELLHVHDFSTTLLAVPAAKLAGCKVIVSRLDLAHYHSPAQRQVLAQLTRMADHVIANADAIRHMLLTEEGLPPERVSVVRNGLDLARFDERRRRGLEAPLPDTGGEPVVIHVANMNHPVKRQEDLLEAIARLNRQGLPVHAFLVGDGPRRPGLQELAARLGVGQRVHFLGHRGDVPALYGHGTLGVLCSSAEGLSNAVMEGMAAGLPLVVTRAGGNPELVAHGERGLVAPPCAPEALAAAFRQLLEAPEEARRMGERARAFVESELGLGRMVAEHDRIYRQVVGGPQALTPE